MKELRNVLERDFNPLYLNETTAASAPRSEKPSYVHAIEDEIQVVRPSQDL